MLVSFLCVPWPEYITSLPITPAVLGQSENSSIDCRHTTHSPVGSSLLCKFLKDRALPCFSSGISKKPSECKSTEEVGRWLESSCREPCCLSDAHIPATGGMEEDLMLPSFLSFIQLYPTVLKPHSSSHSVVQAIALWDTLSADLQYLCIPSWWPAHRVSLRFRRTKCHCGELDLQNPQILFDL